MKDKFDTLFTINSHFVFGRPLRTAMAELQPAGHLNGHASLPTNTIQTAVTTTPSESASTT